MHHKAFNSIIRGLVEHPQKAKDWLLDKRLTNFEKKVIQAHLLVRNNQNAEVIKLFEGIFEDVPEYIFAHKSLVLGRAYNNLSRYVEAKQYFTQATIVFKGLRQDYYYFNSQYNLFMLLSNLQLTNEMKSGLEVMRTIPLDTESNLIKLKCCEFVYHSEVGDDKKAFEYLELIASFQSQMLESDMTSHLVSAFMFFVRIEKFDKCREVLIEMKNYRKFQLSENYNYMKKMLDHLTFNKPLYAYDDEFKDNSFLYDQIKVIQYLEAGEIQESLKHWERLASVAPSQYDEGFIYRGQKSLFSLCLDKLRPKDTKIRPAELNNTRKLLDLLHSILCQADAPLQRRHIYEMIWGEAPEDKDQLRKLSVLVSRLRHDKGIDVQTRKGTYFLIKDISQKKKAG